MNTSANLYFSYCSSCMEESDFELVITQPFVYYCYYRSIRRSKNQDSAFRFLYSSERMILVWFALEFRGANVLWFWWKLLVRNGMYCIGFFHNFKPYLLSFRHFFTNLIWVMREKPKFQDKELKTKWLL